MQIVSVVRLTDRKEAMSSVIMYEYFRIRSGPQW